MENYISNNVNPKFEIKFSENDIYIRQEEKIDNFSYADITSMSIEKGEVDWLAVSFNFIFGLLFEYGDIARKKNDQLQIKTKNNSLYNYSLRYLESEKIEDLKKLINRFL